MMNFLMFFKTLPCNLKFPEEKFKIFELQYATKRRAWKITSHIHLLRALDFALCLQACVTMVEVKKEN